VGLFENAPGGWSHPPFKNAGCDHPARAIPVLICVADDFAIIPLLKAQ
jgi:hypothetical protein